MPRPSLTQPSRHGFTLIELLVVIVIIGILATFAITKLSAFRVKARETQTASNLGEINRALGSFSADNNGLYPFRIRWFNAATVNAPGFDPYVATDTGSGMTSDPGNWFSLGLIGGVRTVTDTFADNTFAGQPPSGQYQLEGFLGMREHKIIQPYGWDQANPQFYRRFNQYSDPLVALGYLGSYPVNPFLRRPMGNIMWNYGDRADESDQSSPFYTLPVANVDSSIPHPNVMTTPGDFVYTFFYDGSGSTILDPGGVVEAKRSYTAKSPKMDDPDGGLYYLDLVDSYQLWAYGNIPTQGGSYAIYRNNAGGGIVKGHNNAKQDWNGNGTRDMFEIGIIQYFKAAGTADAAARTSGGARIEF